MQIACPQCSMTYLLDEALLPPGGAPVQCTQCNHVFTAYPPSAGAGDAGAGQGAAGTAPRRTSTAQYGGTQAPARASTHLFGAPAPEAPPARKSTQVFGTVSPEAPPGRTSTDLFGTVQPPPERTGTGVMGAVQPEPPAPAPRTSTQTFGVVLPAEEAPPPRTGTQTFGAVTGESAPARSDTPEAPRRASTHIFGAVSATPPADAAPTAPAADAPVPAEVPSGRKATQLFAAPGAARTGEAGAASAGQPPPAAPPEPAAQRPQQVRARVALPSGPETLPLDVGEDVGAGTSGIDLSEGRVSRRTLLVVGGALAAGLLALGVWKALANRTYEPPAAAQLARDGAGRLLRRDDLASREKALAELDALVAAEPLFVDARADLAVALALQLDDVKLLLREADATRAELTQQVAQLEAAQEPGDWQNRVNALREQLAEVDRRKVALGPTVAPLEDRLQRAVEGLPGAEAVLPPAQAQAVVRAQSLEQAVKSSAQVVALSERYRQLGATDGWGEVAYAEYVANAPAGRAGLEQAREALRTLKEQDPSFVRLFVLDARLAQLAGDTESARSNLEAVLSLNPAHTLARQLLERVQADSLADGR